jgi:hypothetical protein
MSVGASIGTALAIGGIASAGAGLASGVIGAGASKSAAQTEANASEQATQLQQQEFEQQQQNLAPWLAAGKAELPTLQAGIQPGGQFNLNYGTFASQFPNTPTSFTAPTAEQAAQAPGEQFLVEQANQALQRSQAATGITGGGAAKAISQYNEGLASTNYQNVYNNALQGFNTNLGAAQSLYGQGFNVAASQIGQNYNEAAGLTGIGQTATQQLNQAGQNYANNAGNLLTSGASATAAGQVGAANAYTNALSGLGNSASNAALYSLLGQSSFGGANPLPGSFGSQIGQAGIGQIIGGINGMSAPA